MHASSIVDIPPYQVFCPPQVSLNLVFTVRNTCDLETYIVSVERIKEYADLIPEVHVDHRQH